MTDHPVLFSTEMVRTILEGRKTQTRRIIKESYNGCWTNGGPHPCPNDPVVMYPGEFIKSPFPDLPDFVVDGDKVRAAFFCSTMDRTAYCRFGKPGDWLWVRETCCAHERPDGLDGVLYKADAAFIEIENSQAAVDKWMDLRYYGKSQYRDVPSIHMPKWAARIWLEITEIKVEPLHDISEEDAKAEGIMRDEIGFRDYDKKLQQHYGHPDHDWPHWISPIDSYKSLWESINGNWNENPWVWVIKFKVLSTTGRPELLKELTS